MTALSTVLSYHRPLTLNERAATQIRELRVKPVHIGTLAREFIYGAAPMPAPVLQFIDETLAGEMLREHEVRLDGSATVRARELLRLRFGDNADRACDAFNRGAFRLQIEGAPIDSLDADVRVAPGQAVRLIQLAPSADH